MNEKYEYRKYKPDHDLLEIEKILQTQIMTLEELLLINDDQTMSKTNMTNNKLFQIIEWLQKIEKSKNIHEDLLMNFDTSQIKIQEKLINEKVIFINKQIKYIFEKRKKYIDMSISSIFENEIFDEFLNICFVIKKRKEFEEWLWRRNKYEKKIAIARGFGERFKILNEEDINEMLCGKRERELRIFSEKICNIEQSLNFVIKKTKKINNDYMRLQKRYQVYKEKQYLTYKNSKIIVPKDFVALVFVEIENIKNLFDWNTDVTETCVYMFRNFIHRLLLAVKGYETTSYSSNGFVFAFGYLENAITFSIKIQKGLLKLNWPDETDDYVFTKFEKDANGKVIFRGLRVKTSIHCGYPVVKKNLQTNVYEYFGKVVKKCKSLLEISNGGQTLVSNEVINGIKIKEHLNKILYKKKIGKIKLKGMKNKEDVYLILPKELITRNFEFEMFKSRIHKEDRIKHVRRKLIKGNRARAVNIHRKSMIDRIKSKLKNKIEKNFVLERMKMKEKTMVKICKRRNTDVINVLSTFEKGIIDSIKREKIERQYYDKYVNDVFLEIEGFKEKVIKMKIRNLMSNNQLMILNMKKLENLIEEEKKKIIETNSLKIRQRILDRNVNTIICVCVRIYGEHRNSKIIQPIDIFSPLCSTKFRDKICKLVEERGGVVNGFFGDKLISFWNEDGGIQDEEHFDETVINACKSCFVITKIFQKRLKHQLWNSRLFPKIKIIVSILPIAKKDIRKSHFGAKPKDNLSEIIYKLSNLDSFITEDIVIESSLISDDLRSFFKLKHLCEVNINGKELILLKLGEI